MKRHFMLAIVLLTVVLISQWGQTAPPARPTTPTPAKTIELKFASFYAQPHQMHVAAQWFASELEKRTNGRVKVTIFYGGTLGSSVEAIDNMKKGISDMGYICPQFHPGRYPAWDVFTVPQLFPNAPMVQYVGLELLDQGYLDIKGLKIFAITGAEENRIFLTKKKITTVDGFKGVSLIGLGGLRSQGLQALGASTTDVPLGEVYTSMQRGVTEGILVGVGLSRSFKLEGIVKYVIWNDFGQAPIGVAMNQSKWDSLPQDIQLVITGLSRPFNYQWVDGFCKEEQVGYDAFKKAGADVYSISPEQFNLIIQKMAPIFDNWVKDMESKGLPGKKIHDIVQWDLKKMGYRE